EAKALRLELIGSRLEDASEHTGPLFKERPPRIRALDAQKWKDVRTVVVGEEGSGKGKWRRAFTPDPDKMEQDLPSEVADRKGGWYFLRFYDNDDELIESIDFRFLSVLREIRLPPLLHFPTGDGHKPICVELVYEADCAVQPVGNLAKIQVEHQKDKTLLIVPSDPACDESQWLIGPEHRPRVEVTINVERIWWALGEEDNLPSESQWQDRPVVLSRENLEATSSNALWLRLPKRRWVDKVLVGLERSKARPYRVRVTENAVAIPLREYSDYAEVGDRTQEYSLRLWIKRDHQDMEGVLAVLPASQVIAPMPAYAVSPLTQSWGGVGRKKTAKAKAVMRNGVGEIKVNGRRVDDYFRQAPHKAKQFLERLLDLKEVREVLSQMEVNVTVEGSSSTTMRQPKAVAHALARALMDYDPRLTPLLRQAGFGAVKVKDCEASRGGER
ncbi:MAG: 30S ribosomal protein S9, partial [Candidatus Hadarchaeales archaeon]